jgi:hypothetical protein
MTLLMYLCAQLLCPRRFGHIRSYHAPGNEQAKRSDQGEAFTTFDFLACVITNSLINEHGAGNAL